MAEASAERLFGELRRLVVARGALAGVELADRLGLLRAVLPELHDLHDVEQSRYHHLDVYGHTIEVLAHQIELEGTARGGVRGARAGAARRAARSRSRTSSRAARRSGSARCSTTWASRPRAACARTAG